MCCMCGLVGLLLTSDNNFMLITPLEINLFGDAFFYQLNMVPKMIDVYSDTTYEHMASLNLLLW